MYELVQIQFWHSYVSPQLINDADNKLSGAFGYGNANVKREYSLDHSICNNNEGSPAVYLSLVLCCVIIGYLP